MRVLVCGGREYDNWAHLDLTLSLVYITHVIHGDAKGADFLARVWAKYNHISNSEFKADWKRYGKAAGPIRNTAMLEIGKPELVVAFPGGSGTANMVEQAEAAGVEVREIVSP